MAFQHRTSISTLNPTTIEYSAARSHGSNFNFSDEKGDVVIVGDWVGTDVKPEDRAIFVLGLGITGSERDLYSMYGFNGRGFDQSLKLARKNCVS